jgi:hypothetical protein
MLSSWWPVSLTTLAVVASFLPACPVQAADAQQGVASVPAGMVCRAYPVADLVVPVQTGAPDRPVQTTEQLLIQRITTAIAPATWSVRGGRGTIDYFPLTMTLVINQTPEVHEQVGKFLAHSRKEQDTQVQVEVRLVTMGDDGLERVGIDFGTTPCCDKTPANFVKETCAQIILGDKEVVRFFEAIQADPRTNVMQAPRITVPSGQTAQVNTSDQHWFVTGVEMKRQEGQITLVPKQEAVETGIRMSVEPSVSADRKSIQLRFKVHESEVESCALQPIMIVHHAAADITELIAKLSTEHRCPIVTVKQPGPDCTPVLFTQYLQEPKLHCFSLEKTVTIPNGKTMIVRGGKKVVQVRREYGLPILSKLPYVNRLFRSVGHTRETRNVYLFLTPQIMDGTEVTEHTAAPKCCESTRCATARCCATSACATASVKSGSEEQNAPCRQSAACGRQAKVVAELIRAYEAACAEGQTEEAEKLARAALLLDPTCFSKKR